MDSYSRNLILRYSVGSKKELAGFYVQKRCKHGMKGNDCHFEHPPICPKLLKFGHTNKGCRGGSECDKLHPKMCRHSLRNKECPYEKCRFYHVNGTRYVPEKNDSWGSHEQSYSGETGVHKNNGFLEKTPESFQSLKNDIMEALDMRIATIMSCVQSQTRQESQPGHLQHQNPELPNHLHRHLTQEEGILRPGFLSFVTGHWMRES